MSLNYQMIVVRYPKPTKVVGGLISGHEIFLLLDRRTSQVAMYLMCSHK